MSCCVGASVDYNDDYCGYTLSVFNQRIRKRLQCDEEILLMLYKTKESKKVGF